MSRAVRPVVLIVALSAAVVAGAVLVGYLRRVGTAADFVVNSNDDLPDRSPGDGICDTGSDPARPTCTLRAAIDEANRRPGPDVVDVGPHYVLRLRTSGLRAIDVSDPVELVGAGSDRTVIDAGGVDVIFHLSAGAEVRLDHLTVVGGDNTGPADRPDGRAVLNDVVTTDDRARVARVVAGEGGADAAKQAVAFCGVGRGQQYSEVAHAEISDSLGLTGLVGGVF